MRRMLKFLGVAVLAILAVIVFNTIRYAPAEELEAAEKLPTVDGSVVAEKLSQAIQFKTI